MTESQPTRYLADISFGEVCFLSGGIWQFGQPGDFSLKDVLLCYWGGSAPRISKESTLLGLDGNA